MIVCDMDGTLVPSKLSPDTQMSDLIERLLLQYSFAVISGASIELFSERFLSRLTLTEQQSQNLYLLPSIGAGMYILENNYTKKIYEELLTTSEFQHISAVVLQAAKLLHLVPAEQFGPTLEMRGTSATYSALGQDAPFDLKTQWDMDQKKRQELLAIIVPQLPDFNIAIGGLTSIDITRAGIDKAYGITKLSEYTKIPVSDMLYVGDALYENGNDYAVYKTGVDCLPVKTVAETKQLFRDLLAQSGDN